jgi:adenylate cyclase
MTPDVTCSQCGTDHPAGARFCMACGAPLARACAACGTPAPPEARFCLSCGAPLAAASPIAAGPMAPAGAQPERLEERRRATILFADLSGFTAASESLDPEAARSLSNRCLRRLAEEVVRYGGTVDKFIGDNVMAVFGVPVSHEDDAERAVRAALAMQQAMRELGDQGMTLSLRVGVNTGEVIAGAVGDSYTVMGDAVNVAARLQAAAPVGGIVVGERTFRATREAIEYGELGTLSLKGKTEPVPAWQALGAATAQRASTSVRRQAPLVGRRDELELIESLAARAVHERRRQLVTILGEAGVGKSRLLSEIVARLRADDLIAAVHEGRCLPYGAGVAYWALAEVVRADCAIDERDDAGAAWEKLSRRVAELTGEDGPRTAAVIGRSLGFEVPGEALIPEEDDPQRLRDRFFAAVRSYLQALVDRRPVLLAFEDIHWADHGMLDLIEHLVDWVRGPLMIVCLAREELLERRRAWAAGRRDAASVVLQPLASLDARALAVALLETFGGASALPDTVVERSGGNPLFLEEMVRRLVEEGAVADLDLPDTVQGLLAVRLDALAPTERRLLQHAAVIGRTFDREALVALAGQEEAAVAPVLAAVEARDLIVRTPESRDEFAFKHVLIRDVAYDMLPKALRSRRHLAYGEFLERRAGDRTDEVVGLLAQHFGRAAVLGLEAGLDDDQLEPMRVRARAATEAAGDAAARIYSNREALDHYRHCRSLTPVADREAHVRLADKLGDVALRMGRAQEALDEWHECLALHAERQDAEAMGELHRKLGVAMWQSGQGAKAIEHYQQGIALLKDGPPRAALARLYEEAAWLYMQAGDNMLAIYAAEKALRLAQQLGEAEATSRAYGIFGRVFGRIGDLTKARENLERSVELARHSDLSAAVRALVALGYHLDAFEADYTGARAAFDEALELASRLGDVPAQVEVHHGLAQLAVYVADWEAVRRSSQASAELAEREGIVGLLCLPEALRGLLAWREGDLSTAERAYRRARELATQAGWSEMAFSSLFGLAIVLRDRGDDDGAARALEEAEQVCDRAGLVTQSLQALAARAVVLALGGHREQARAAAERAAALIERSGGPVAATAVLEARGVTGVDAGDRVAVLRDAKERWEKLHRPLDAARASFVLGLVLREQDPEAAAVALDEAAGAYQRLELPHLAQRARELAMAAA